MTQKIAILHWPADYTLSLGGTDKLKFIQGKVLIPEKLYFDTIQDFLVDNFGPGPVVVDYDPANPEHQISAPKISGAFGSDKESMIMQGPVTIQSFKGAPTNPAIGELDSMLAQALVTGNVDSLVAENPDVLNGAGFVENSAAPVAPKPMAVPKSKT